ncbi:MAG: hypothetical protein V4590_00120 [Bacteroidota bacterium]
MIHESHISPKRISAIFLLLLFSYNVVFSHVSLWLWKVYMNEQIEELAIELPNESLEKIMLPHNGSIEHEIAYNGAMYDVIRYEQHGATITYFCVKDFTENILSSLQDESLSAKSNLARQAWKGHAKKLQKKTADNYTPSCILPIICPIPKLHVYAPSDISTSVISITINTPPPDKG